jgi:LPPG:FO 2-phospho-L-lactate transferase
VHVALAGGVGSARFLRGLVDVAPAEGVTVIGNTGDDDWFHGLLVCPDLDSVTYTLAGANSPETGWGLADETFTTLAALERYGVDTWFRLGDRDLATHLYRTQRLRSGATLSAITADIATAWGLRCRLLPMSDDRVATRITARAPDGGTSDLAMEEWFVRERAQPTVLSVRYAGADAARPAVGVLDALIAAHVVVVCPANPILSIGPILALGGVRDVLRERREHVVAISGLIAGRAVKGPADTLLRDLGIEPSCVGVAGLYRDLCATFVIDDQDAARAREIEDLGLRVVITDTLMRDPAVAAELARVALAAAP